MNKLLRTSLSLLLALALTFALVACSSKGTDSMQDDITNVQDTLPQDDITTDSDKIADDVVATPEPNTEEEANEAITEQEQVSENYTVELNHNYVDTNDTATIQCKNNGEIVWEYQTGTYPLTELAPISDAYINEDRVYVCEATKLVALDKETGELVWESEDAISYSTKLVFDDQNIYGTAYYGPNFIVISKENGEILCQEFSEEYSWSYDLKVEGNTLYVTFDSTDEGVLDEPVMVEFDITPYR